VSKPKPQVGMKQVTISCRACDNGVTAKRDILPYKRIYLKDCPTHLQMWDEADAADRAKESKRKK
jgi:hypothetical protein